MRLLTITIICFCINTQSSFGQATSFSLDEAIAYAIRHSDQTKIDSLNLIDAEESIREFKSIGLPKLNANFGYNYNLIRTQQAIRDFISPAVYNVLFFEQLLEQRDLGEPESFEVTFQTRHFLNLGLEASALIFDGSYLVGLEAAKVFRDLSTKNTDLTQQEIRNNVTKAYINRIIFDENIKTIDKNIKNLNDITSETKALYQEGFVEQLDVDRLELSIKNLEFEKTRLTQTAELSNNLLKFQMNYPLDADLRLTQGLDELLEVLKVYEADLLQDIDYNKRAEYAQLNTAKTLNELDLKRIKKSKLPSVRASAALNGSIQRDDLFNGDESNILPGSFIGLGVSLPIYDGNENSAQQQRRKLAVQKSGIEIEKFEKAVDIQVKNARIAYLNALQAIDNIKSSLELSEKIYDKAVIKYREGVGSSLEVNQAEQSLFQLQSQYTNAIYDLVISKADIDIALGKL